MTSTLEETIVKLGVDVAEYEVLAHASPDPAQMSDAYRAVNEHLLSIVSQKALGACMHLTGECAAVVDPLHRRTCRAMWDHHREHCVLISCVPPEHRDSPSALIRWHRQKWHDRPRPWTDFLDAFFLFASPALVHATLDSMAPMHYSVFGDELVLLQSPHHHPEMLKSVWFLKSPSLNHALKRQMAEIRRHAPIVHDNLYREFTLSIQSKGAIEILAMLVSVQSESVDVLIAKSRQATPAHIDNLEAIGFLSLSDDRVSILDAGREYLAL